MTERVDPKPDTIETRCEKLAGWLCRGLLTSDEQAVWTPIVEYSLRGFTKNAVKDFAPDAAEVSRLRGDIATARESAELRLKCWQQATDKVERLKGELAELRAILDRPLDDDLNVLLNHCEEGESLSLAEQRELYRWLTERGETMEEMQSELEEAESELTTLRAENARLIALAAGMSQGERDARGEEEKLPMVGGRRCHVGGPLANGWWIGVRDGDAKACLYLWHDGELHTHATEYAGKLTGYWPTREAAVAFIHELAAKEQAAKQSAPVHQRDDHNEALCPVCTPPQPEPFPATTVRCWKGWDGIYAMYDDRNGFKFLWAPKEVCRLETSVAWIAAGNREIPPSTAYADMLTTFPEGAARLMELCRGNPAKNETARETPNEMSDPVKTDTNYTQTYTGPSEQSIGPQRAAPATVVADCHCERCIKGRHNSLYINFMPLCPTCGNKRCPKAEWHGYACTGSNTPGQVGTVETPAPPQPAVESELEKGKDYLRRLFGIVAPQCTPMDHLCGLVSQIDNYLAGQRDDLADAKARIRELESHLAAALQTGDMLLEAAAQRQAKVNQLESQLAALQSPQWITYTGQELEPGVWYSEATESVFALPMRGMRLLLDCRYCRIGSLPTKEIEADDE